MVGAHVIFFCNIVLTCFIVPMLKGCVSPTSEVHQRESCHDMETAPVNGGTRTLEGWRLDESSAAVSTLMFGGFTFQAPLPSLLAAGDAVGPAKVVVRR